MWKRIGNGILWSWEKLNPQDIFVTSQTRGIFQGSGRVLFFLLGPIDFVMCLADKMYFWPGNIYCSSALYPHVSLSAIEVKANNK